MATFRVHASTRATHLKPTNTVAVSELTAGLQSAESAAAEKQFWEDSASLSDLTWLWYGDDLHQGSVSWRIEMNNECSDCTASSPATTITITDRYDSQRIAATPSAYTVSIGTLRQQGTRLAAERLAYFVDTLPAQAVIELIELGPWRDHEYSMPA